MRGSGIPVVVRSCRRRGTRGAGRHGGIASGAEPEPRVPDHGGEQRLRRHHRQPPARRAPVEQSATIISRRCAPGRYGECGWRQTGARTDGSPGTYENSFRGDMHSHTIAAQIEDVAIQVSLTGEVPAWRPRIGYMYFGAQDEQGTP